MAGPGSPSVPDAFSTTDAVSPRSGPPISHVTSALPEGLTDPG